MQSLSPALARAAGSGQSLCTHKKESRRIPVNLPRSVSRFSSCAASDSSPRFLHVVTDGLITHSPLFHYFFSRVWKGLLIWCISYEEPLHYYLFLRLRNSWFFIFAQIKFSALNVYAILFIQINQNSQIFLQSLISL